MPDGNERKGDYDQMNNFLGLITFFFSFELEAFSDNVRLVFIKSEIKAKALIKKKRKKQRKYHVDLLQAEEREQIPDHRHPADVR